MQTRRDNINGFEVGGKAESGMKVDIYMGLY